MPTMKDVAERAEGTQPREKLVTSIKALGGCSASVPSGERIPIVKWVLTLAPLNH